MVAGKGDGHMCGVEMDDPRASVAKSQVSTC